MKLKRLLAALLVLCMVMPWIPADAAAVVHERMLSQ